MQDIEKQLDAAIVKYELHGRSFDYGQALYHMMKNCDMSDDMRDMVYQYIDDHYDEVIAMLKTYNLSDGDMATWAELIPLDSLDEMARELAGVEE